MPSWLERDGKRRPLVPGTKIQNGDRLITGDSARVLLRLSEGSKVRIGENAIFQLHQLSPPEEEGGFFKGALEMFKGALRFTTSVVGKRRNRDIRIKLGVVTAGIRGTDVWAENGPEKEIVCLIEGGVIVQRIDDPPVLMNEPLSFYVAPKGGEALPVGLVPEKKLKEWKGETELQSGESILTSGGDWVVRLASVQRLDWAKLQAENLYLEGYPVELAEAEVNGSLWYRLFISGFASREEAEGFASIVDGDSLGSLEIDGAWVDFVPR